MSSSQRLPRRPAMPRFRQFRRLTPWLVPLAFAAGACGGDGIADKADDARSGANEVRVPHGEELGQGVLIDPDKIAEMSEFRFEISDTETADLPGQAVVTLRSRSDEAWIAPGPPGWDLQVVWGALPCQVRPTITVNGTERTLESVTIALGPEVLPDADPATACESMEARHAAYLKTPAMLTPETTLTLSR